jgi:hypothetical protein
MKKEILDSAIELKKLVGKEAERKRATRMDGKNVH